MKIINAIPNCGLVVLASTGMLQLLPSLIKGLVVLITLFFICIALLMICAFIDDIRTLIIEVKQQKAKVRQQKAKRQKVEAERQKVEAERQRVEAERQSAELEIQENLRPYCDRLIDNFWNDFLSGNENLVVLTARLKFYLEGSGYKNWYAEFFVPVSEKLKKCRRPQPLKNDQTAKMEENVKITAGYRLLFNGIFLTSEQCRILSQYPDVKEIRGKELEKLCRKLAEKMPEFAEFRETEDGADTPASPELDDFYAFLGLTPQTLTAESLKKAYRLKAVSCHPDKNPTAAAAADFQKLQEAYAALTIELNKTAKAV